MSWSFVIPHFKNFLDNLELTDAQKQTVLTRVLNVGSCLHKHYYGQPFIQKGNVRVVGSHGKGTSTRPPSDIDILFILPRSEFQRFQNRSGYVQSQLLQEVKNVLSDTFPRTDLRADGQVIKSPFSDFSVEVVPAFLSDDGRYVVCDTNNGGSWKLTDPDAEQLSIQQADSVSLGKATHLIKMLKAWKKSCNVEIKSVVLEIAACCFVHQWPHKHQSLSLFWHDWMMRDFFGYFLQLGNGTATIPGTGEIIPLGDQWVSRCESAHERALKACDYEYQDQAADAAQEWQKIFGSQFSSIETMMRVLFG